MSQSIAESPTPDLVTVLAERAAAVLDSMLGDIVSDVEFGAVCEDDPLPCLKDGASASTGPCKRKKTPAPGR